MNNQEVYKQKKPCWFFHKCKGIYKYVKSELFDETYPEKSYTNFEICIKCNTVYEGFSYPSQSYKEIVNNEKRKIIVNKLINGELKI